MQAQAIYRSMNVPMQLVQRGLLEINSLSTNRRRAM